MTEPRVEDSGRTRIIQVARQLFTDRGFSDVSMQQIADAAGLRKASIYYHFASKVDLFIAVSWLELEELHDQTVLAMASADSLPEQLVAITEAWILSIRGDRGRLMREMQEYMPVEEQRKFESKMERFEETIASAFAAAADRGELRDLPPLTASRYFTDLVSGAVFRTYLAPTTEGEGNPAETARELVDCLLFGIATPALARGAACSSRLAVAD